MRFFAQARKIFNGKQPQRETDYHVDGNKAPELQPGKRRAVDAKPHRLPDDDVGFSRLFGWKAPVKEVHNGQNCTRQSDQDQYKKSPARPDVWKCLGDQKVQPAPASKHEKKRRKPERLEGEWLVFHCGHYTLEECRNERRERNEEPTLQTNRLLQWVLPRISRIIAPIHFRREILGYGF